MQRKAFFQRANGGNIFHTEQISAEGQAGISVRKRVTFVKRKKNGVKKIVKHFFPVRTAVAELVEHSGVFLCAERHTEYLYLHVLPHSKVTGWVFLHKAAGKRGIFACAGKGIQQKQPAIQCRGNMVIAACAQEQADNPANPGVGARKHDVNAARFRGSARHNSRWSLMTRRNMSPSRSAALRQRSMRPRKISK